MVEIASEKQNKVKRLKRTKDSLRDLWDNIKCTNIRITEVQINEEEIGKLPEKVFRIMIVKMIKNLESKMGKMQKSI